MFHSKRKRDVSGITPSSVAKDAVDKKQTLKFKSIVDARACYGVDALDKYRARTLSLF